MSLFRHTFFTSLASAVIGGVSAVYALLIARFYSDQPLTTDAFFLAYSVYMLVTTFSVTLRVSVAPMLMPSGGEDLQRIHGKLALSVTALFGGIALIIALFCYPLGHGLAHGLPAEGRHLTSLLLLAFSPVIFLLGMSFFYSAVLGALGEFEYVGIAMIIASLSGVAIFAAAHGMGIFSVVLGFFVFNLMLVGFQWWKMRAKGLVSLTCKGTNLEPAALYRALAPIFRASAVYVAVHLVYVISQSFCSRHAEGTATVFGYAYMLMVMIVSVTAGSMGIALAPRFGEYARREGSEFFGYVAQQMTRANRIACVAIAAAAVAAYPLGLFVFSILPGEGNASGLERARLFAHLFWSMAPGAWGLSLFSVLAPAVIAMGNRRYFARSAIGAIAVHILVSLLFGLWLGPIGLGAGISLTLILFGFFFALRFGGCGNRVGLASLLLRWFLWALLMASIAGPFAYAARFIFSV